VSIYEDYEPPRYDPDHNDESWAAPPHKAVDQPIVDAQGNPPPRTYLFGGGAPGSKGFQGAIRGVVADSLVEARHVLHAEGHGAPCFLGCLAGPQLGEVESGDGPATGSGQSEALPGVAPAVGRKGQSVEELTALLADVAPLVDYLATSKQAFRRDVYHLVAEVRPRIRALLAGAERKAGG